MNQELANIDPNAIQAAVLELMPGIDPDKIGAALMMVERLREVAKQMEELLLDQIGALLKAGERVEVVIDGDGNRIFYYFGKTKKTVCRDKVKTFDIVLNANGGDMEAVANHMASQPWKYGGLKAVLSQDQWDECFEVVEDEKVESKPVKVNTKYLTKKEQ